MRYEVKQTKTNLQKYFHLSSLNHLIFTVSSGNAKSQQKVQILKKTIDRFACIGVINLWPQNKFFSKSAKRVGLFKFHPRCRVNIIKSDVPVQGRRYRGCSEISETEGQKIEVQSFIYRRGRLVVVCVPICVSILCLKKTIQISAIENEM